MRMPNAVSSLPDTTAGNTLSRVRLRKTRSGGVTNKLPQQVLRRNERERRRVQQVNIGFINLRDRVPHSATSKKLSKVETLREAARYIKHLQDLLQGTCNKPFEPLSVTQEQQNCRGPCSSQENHYPLTNQMPAICEFSCASESYSSEPYYHLYSQRTNNNLSYQKSSFHFDNSMVKCENDLPNTSSSSLDYSDTTRFQHPSYVL
ncbi:unnamed protein product [Gongylonema pulchrum]|uniref:BHLH domain-containing protein n=1 Tax=Gongylonema pulchrum TaxID=637853 RepID=A0A183D1S6_9BILA|nr:unnamed protein product [Gongylonema pulchrum]